MYIVQRWGPPLTLIEPAPTGHPLNLWLIWDGRSRASAPADRKASNPQGRAHHRGPILYGVGYPAHHLSEVPDVLGCSGPTLFRCKNEAGLPKAPGGQPHFPLPVE